MRLNAKLILFLLIFSVITSFFLVFLTNKLLLQNYYDLENEFVEIKFEQINENIIGLKKKNKGILRDWAHWDASYDFIEKRDIEFIKSNVDSSTFRDLQLDYMVFLDKDNNLVYGRKYEYQRLKNITFDMADLFRNSKVGSGFYQFEDKVLVLNKEEITPSNSEPSSNSNSNGYLVFAYFLDEKSFKSISNFDYLSLVYNFNQDILFENKYKLDRKFEKLRLLFYLPYENSPEAIEIEILFDNEISKLGEKNYNYTLIIIIGFIFILVYLLKILIDFFVVKPITKLNSTVKSINLKSKKNTRIDIKKITKDEISQLKNSINQMLDKIEKQNNKLRYLAVYDSLTGCYNRKIGLKKLEKLIVENREEPLNIAYIDINDLKLVNDQLGHLIGDHLIKDTTNLILDVIRPKDFLTRLGGDEFLIVFPNTYMENVEKIVDELLDKIEKFNLAKKREYVISISIGIQDYQKNMTVDVFVDTADQKMYEEKKRIKSLYSK